MKHSTSKTRGFTLVELMVVMFIIAILMTVLLSALGDIMARAKKEMCRSNLKRIYEGLGLYQRTFDGYWPADGYFTFGTWMPKAAPAPDASSATPDYEGFSWQQVLDRLLGSVIDEGAVFNTPEYRVNGEVVNRRGVSPIFKDPVRGNAGDGLYIGTVHVFKHRVLKDGSYSEGPLNVIVLEADGLNRGIIPVAADATRANTDELWIRRYTRVRTDVQGQPVVYAKVVGTYMHTTTSDPGGTTFVNLEFRHQGEVMVLYMDGQVRSIRQGSLEASQLPLAWDNLFPCKADTDCPAGMKCVGGRCQ